MRQLHIEQFWQSALIILMLCFSQQSMAQAGPESFAYESLPTAEKREVVQEAIGASELQISGGELGIADRMALEYRITQERYRFYEVIMLAVVAVFSLIVVLSFIRKNPNCQPRDMVNTTGLILVIFSTIIVILLADVEVQLTAAMGVLGGIAGYLFGTFNAPHSERKVEEKQREDGPSG